MHVHRLRTKDELLERLFEVDSATVINVGDLVWQDTDDLKAAADTTWDTNLATTQANFKAIFAGVAMLATAAGETEKVTVYGRGVYEFVCAAATFEIGDLVGPAKAAGNALLSDTVVGVAAATEAIGRVVKRYGANTTSVEVAIFSNYIAGAL